MKRSIMLLVWVSAFTASFAQSTEDGIKGLDYENYATAKRIFTQLIKQNSADGRNYYYLGQALSALGKNDSARLVYTAGTQADPKSIYNNIGLGRTYLDQNNVQ